AQELRLAEMAKRCGEDLELLRDEFAAYCGPDPGDSSLEPWDEPVETAVLLTELITQLRRYIVLHADVAIAVALWTMLAWVHEIAVHSPILILPSVEPDTGKTT